VLDKSLEQRSPVAPHRSIVYASNRVAKFNLVKLEPPLRASLWSMRNTVLEAGDAGNDYALTQILW
jgi:hypothetical protein